eukprot:XP_014037916.1 PREDICTED: uncharacterized protein LOC106591229 [Salmo salar]
MILLQPISFHLRASSRRHSYHILIIIVFLSIFIIFIIIIFVSIFIIFIIMFRVLIHLAALPLWVTGQLFSSMVHQRPVALTEGPGGNVPLTCSHTIPNYYMILWYKQSAGDTAMKLIGYAYTKSITMEKSFEKHFNVSGDGEKEAYLHLVSLRGPEHSAVYYCVASQHSDVEFLLFSTKTLSDVFQSSGETAVLSCSHTLPSYNTILWYQQVEHTLPSYNTILWYQQVEHTLPSYNTILWYQQVEHTLPSYNTILWYQQVEHTLPSYNTILWYQQVEHTLPSYNTILWCQQVEHTLPSYNTILWYQQVEHTLPSYNTILL